MQGSVDEFYRVFAYGPGYGYSLSVPLSRNAAEDRRREWRRAMPDADVRVEKVNVQGWPA